jgi:hypothetical protein
VGDALLRSAERRLSLSQRFPACPPPLNSLARSLARNAMQCNAMHARTVCRCVQVKTSASSGITRPVMVFIHGGGYQCVPAPLASPFLPSAVVAAALAAHRCALASEDYPRAPSVPMAGWRMRVGDTVVIPSRSRAVCGGVLPCLLQSPMVPWGDPLFRRLQVGRLARPRACGCVDVVPGGCGARHAQLQVGAACPLIYIASPCLRAPTGCCARPLLVPGGRVSVCCAMAASPLRRA